MDHGIKRYKSRWVKLRTERDPWLKVMRDLAQWICLRQGRFLTSDRNRPKFNNNVVNDTATWAWGVFGAGMTSGVTSPARPWFKTTTLDPELARFARVQQWLATVDERLRRVFAMSNFYTSAMRLYLDEGGFGQGLMLMAPNVRTTLHCTNVPAGSFCFAVDQFGRVNTTYREDRWTVSQCVGRFGRENVSIAVRNAFDRGKFDDWVDVMHLIEPRAVRDHDRPDNLNMPWRSVYYEMSASDRVLNTSGFEHMPAVCPRWNVNGNDAYATGPAHQAFGVTRGLQNKERRAAQGIDKMSNPTMTGPASMKTMPSTTIPGGMTYEPTGTQGARGGYRPAYQVDPRIRELDESIGRDEGRIQRAFMADLFLMMISDPRVQPATATEIAERHDEKLLMLGPPLERQNTEFLDPAIDLAFEYGLDADMIPIPPPELEGQPLRVEYVSILHQAQRAVGTANVDRLVGFTQSLMQTHPDAGAKLGDGIDIVDTYADLLGTPPRLVVPTAEARRLAAEGRRAAARQATLDAAQQSADTAAALGQTPSARGGEGSLLGEMMGVA